MDPCNRATILENVRLLMHDLAFRETEVKNVWEKRNLGFKLTVHEDGMDLDFRHGDLVYLQCKVSNAYCYRVPEMIKALSM